MTYSKQAENTGAVDYKEGKDVSQNPFNPDDTIFYDSWISGFNKEKEFWENHSDGCIIIMKEQEYLDITNLCKLRIAETTLRDCLFMDEIDKTIQGAVITRIRISIEDLEKKISNWPEFEPGSIDKMADALDGLDELFGENANFVTHTIDLCENPEEHKQAIFACENKMPLNIGNKKYIINRFERYTEDDGPYFIDILTLWLTEKKN